MARKPKVEDASPEVILGAVLGVLPVRDTVVLYDQAINRRALVEKERLRQLDLRHLPTDPLPGCVFIRSHTLECEPIRGGGWNCARGCWREAA